ncbi:6674_t:CDS:2 [Entrophospora sp. SA101]|nr:6674_t:CDS:2 [Entrophospora sp. SA101]
MNNQEFKTLRMILGSDQKLDRTEKNNEESKQKVPENYKHNTRVINNGYGDGNNITSLEEIDLINLDGATVTYNQQNDSSNNLNYNCLIETLLCDLHFGSKSSIGDVVNVLQPKSLAINEKSILDNNHNNKNGNVEKPIVNNNVEKSIIKQDNKSVGDSAQIEYQQIVPCDNNEKDVSRDILNEM